MVIMTMRAFFAAILGGIAMFIWSFVAHDLLPLGETGMREFNDEAPMLDALKTNLGHAGGLYHFPGHKAGPNATRQEKNDAMKRAMEKAASGPSGMLLYHPTREFSFGKLLGIEFATELLEEFRRPGRFRSRHRNSCGNHHEHSVLELVWLPFQLHRCLHVY